MPHSNHRYAVCRQSPPTCASPQSQSPRSGQKQSYHNQNYCRCTRWPRLYLSFVKFLIESIVWQNLVGAMPPCMIYMWCCFLHSRTEAGSERCHTAHTRRSTVPQWNKRAKNTTQAEKAWWTITIANVLILQIFGVSILAKRWMCKVTHPWI